MNDSALPNKDRINHPPGSSDLPLIVGCIFLLFLIVASIAADMSGKPLLLGTSQIESIAGEWKVRQGDNAEWASPAFDDADWQVQQVPSRAGFIGGDGKANFGWIRKTLQIPHSRNAEFSHASIAGYSVTIGMVKSAYQIFADGAMIGEVGRMPPESYAVHDRIATFSLPPEALADGEVLLALRIWHPAQVFDLNAGGVYTGPMLLAPSEALLFTDIWRHFIPAGISALMLVLFMLIAKFYWHNRQYEEQLPLAFLALAIAFYMFFASQWKHAVPLPFLVAKKLEVTGLFLTMFFGVRCFWPHLNLLGRRLVVPASMIFPALSLIVLFCNNIPAILFVVKLAQPFFLALLILFPVLLCINAVRNVGFTRYYVPSFVVLIVTGAHDFYAYQFSSLSADMVPIGAASVVVSAMMLVYKRFSDVYNVTERLVQERTRQLVEANDEMRKMVDVDPLTGIYNRRAFASRVKEELARSKRRDKVLSIALIDVDQFKAFNDRYGHGAGDQALIRVANLLSSGLREGDIVCRWGGEEFVILLADANVDQALPILERIRVAVEAAEILYDGEALKVTFTAGVADSSRLRDFANIFDAADDAMYNGKAAGRNRVMAAEVI
ncbi:MAG: diguanylate cyclase [bacterium]